MKKILFIAANEWGNWGGSELLWMEAAGKLAGRGIEVRVSVPNFGKPINEVERLRLAGIRIVYRKPPSILYRVGLKMMLLPEYSRRHVNSMGKGVDLIVVSQGSNTDGLLWLEAARAAGQRYAVISQCASDFSWPNDETAKRLAKSYECASGIYFVSEANLNLSRRQFATSLLRAKVVRNPFNVHYQAQPTWPGDSSEELSLACVGRLDAIMKGQDVLLEVLALQRWRERNVRVSLIGKGVNERVLRQQALQLNLTSAEFVGYCTDVEEIWSRHHALVLPSRQEGLPLTLVEAMLCGRAGIVTDVGGNRELVRDGVNGFLAKAPTVDLLDEAMNRAWESRGRLKEIGSTAASDVRRLYSADPSEDFVQELTALVGT